MIHKFPHRLEHLLTFDHQEQEYTALLCQTKPSLLNKTYRSTMIEFPCLSEFLSFVERDDCYCTARLVWYRIFSAIEHEKKSGSYATLKAISDMPSLSDRSTYIGQEKNPDKPAEHYLKLLDCLVRS